MRLPPLSPNELDARQKALYDEMKIGVGAKYQDFVTMRADGAFLGPWNCLAAPARGRGGILDRHQSDDRLQTFGRCRQTGRHHRGGGPLRGSL